MVDADGRLVQFKRQLGQVGGKASFPDKEEVVASGVKNA
jgi:hypothetical protein